MDEIISRTTCLSEFTASGFAVKTTFDMSLDKIIQRGKIVLAMGIQMIYTYIYIYIYINQKQNTKNACKAKSVVYIIRK